MFNLIDTAATLHFTGSGIMRELNPIMRALLSDPAAFVGVKVGGMTALAVYLWRRRRYKLARVAALVGAVLYGAIAVYYIVCAIIL